MKLILALTGFLSCTMVFANSNVPVAPCKPMPSLDEIKQSQGIQSIIQNGESGAWSGVPETCHFASSNDQWNCTPDVTNCDNSTGPTVPFNCTATIEVDCAARNVVTVGTIRLSEQAVLGCIPGYATVTSTTTYSGN